MCGKWESIFFLYIIHKRSPAIFSGLLFLDFLIRLKKWRNYLYCLFWYALLCVQMCIRDSCIPTLLSYRQQPTESSLTFSFLFNVYLNYAAKVHKFSKIEPILIQYDRLLYLYFLFFYLLLPSENIYKLNFYHESLYEDLSLIHISSKKESLRIDKKDIPVLVLLGFFYTASAMFLFWGYNFMSAGIATTLHFTYPIFVTLIMLLFFREKTSWVTLLAIGLAICGVARLSINEGEMKLSVLGVFIVLLSAVGYALYITTVNKSRVHTLSLIHISGFSHRDTLFHRMITDYHIWGRIFFSYL